MRILYTGSFGRWQVLEYSAKRMDAVFDSHRLLKYFAAGSPVHCEHQQSHAAKIGRGEHGAPYAKASGRVRRDSTWCMARTRLTGLQRIQKRLGCLTSSKPMPRHDLRLTSPPITIFRAPGLWWTLEEGTERCLVRFSGDIRRPGEFCSTCHMS